MLIYIVGHHDDVGIFGQHVHQSLKLVGGVDAACGIGRRADQHHAGPGGDGCFKLSRRDLEILVDGCGNGHTHTLGEFHHFHIAYPCRGRDYHFIAGIYGRKNHIAEFLFGAVAHDDLFGSEFHAVFPRELGRDGFAQRKIAGHGRIEREIIVDGLLGCFFYVGRSVEIRFAYGKVDYVNSLGAQLGAFLRHGQCG